MTYFPGHKSTKVCISLWVEEEDFDNLYLLAKQYKISRSEIVRQGIYLIMAQLKGDQGGSQSQDTNPR